MKNTTSAVRAGLFGGALLAAGIASAQSISINGEIQGTNAYGVDTQSGYIGYVAAFPYDYSNPLPEETVTYAYFGSDGGESTSSMTVDHWSFSVTDTGTVEIDTLSWGIGDTWLDTYLRLFRDDGDDNPLGLDRNDSISTLDSFLSVELDAGDYIIAIGGFFLSSEEAVEGRSDGYLVARGDQAPTSGQYRLDIFGEFVVPAPSTAGVLALAGLAARRRR